MNIERTSGGEVHSPNDSETDESVTYRLLHYVAALRGVAVVDLPPLRRTVVPEALDALFPPNGDGACSLSLWFAETRVTVDENGDVRVKLLEEEG
jgi:hypothetical protein